jgi:hypothetical protein
MLFNLALEFILGKLSIETKLFPSQKADKQVHSTTVEAVYLGSDQSINGSKECSVFFTITDRVRQR